MEADDVITDFSDLSKVAKLSNDAHYHDVMQRVRRAAGFRLVSIARKPAAHIGRLHRLHAARV